MSYESAIYTKLNRYMRRSADFDFSNATVTGGNVFSRRNIAFSMLDKIISEHNVRCSEYDELEPYVGNDVVESRNHTFKFGGGKLEVSKTLEGDIYKANFPKVFLTPQMFFVFAYGPDICELTVSRRENLVYAAERAGVDLTISGIYCSDDERGNENSVYMPWRVDDFNSSLREQVKSPNRRRGNGKKRKFREESAIRRRPEIRRIHDSR